MLMKKSMKTVNKRNCNIYMLFLYLICNSFGCYLYKKSNFLCVILCTRVCIPRTVTENEKIFKKIN